MQFFMDTSIPRSKLWNRKGEGILVLLNAARIKMCNAFDHQVGWFLVRRVTDNVGCHSTPRSFRAEPPFGLRLLSWDAQMRGAFFGVYKSLCLMPTGLVTTWRLTRGAALESSLFSMMWWTKIVQLDVLFFVGLAILETEIQPLGLQPLSHWLDASTSVEWCSSFFLHWKKSRLTGRMWTRHLQKVVHDRCPTSLRCWCWCWFQDIYKDIGGIAKTSQNFSAYQLDTVSLWICTLCQSQTQNWRSLNLISRRTNCPMLEPWFLLSITGITSIWDGVLKHPEAHSITFTPLATGPPHGPNESKWSQMCRFASSTSAVDPEQNPKNILWHRKDYGHCLLVRDAHGCRRCYWFPSFISFCFSFVARISFFLWRRCHLDQLARIHSAPSLRESALGHCSVIVMLIHFS